MIWHGALQSKGKHQRLEPHKGDVRVVVFYTHTFVLGEPNGRADDREHPFYTATADSPEIAEKQAYMVYLRSQKCTHDMQNKTPTLLECPRCGIQQRVPLAAQNETAETEDNALYKPIRRFLGLFS